MKGRFMIPVDFVRVHLLCVTQEGVEVELEMSSWKQTPDGPVFNFQIHESEVQARKVVMTLVTKAGVSDIEVGIKEQVNTGDCTCHGMSLTVAMTDPWVLHP